MKWIAGLMPLFWAAFGFVAVTALLGCGVPLAETRTSINLPNGMEASYRSQKNQKIVATFKEIDPDDGKILKEWSVTLQAVTPEAAIQALAERDKVTAETLKALVDKLLTAGPPIL